MLTDTAAEGLSDSEVGREEPATAEEEQRSSSQRNLKSLFSPLNLMKSKQLLNLRQRQYLRMKKQKSRQTAQYTIIMKTRQKVLSPRSFKKNKWTFVRKSLYLLIMSIHQRLWLKQKLWQRIRRAIRKHNK